MQYKSYWRMDWDKINFRLTTDDIMFENRSRNKVTVGLFEKQIINIYI